MSVSIIVGTTAVFDVLGGEGMVSQMRLFSIVILKMKVFEIGFSILI